jgi:GTPase
VDMPNGQQAIFSDTVGFISDLPTNLIAAFRATLEEVLEADVILHIRDISHPETEAQKEDVMMILQSLGIKDEKEKKIFEVWNKIDLVSEEASEVLFNTAERNDNVVIVSATTGAGVDDLLNHLDLKLAEDKKLFELKFNHTDGADVSLFYRYGEVIDRVDDEDHTMIKVRLDAAAIGQLIKMGKMPDIPEMEEINED